MSEEQEDLPNSNRDPQTSASASSVLVRDNTTEVASTVSIPFKPEDDSAIIMALAPEEEEDTSSTTDNPDFEARLGAILETAYTSSPYEAANGEEGEERASASLFGDGGRRRRSDAYVNLFAEESDEEDEHDRGHRGPSSSSDSYYLPRSQAPSQVLTACASRNTYATSRIAEDPLSRTARTGSSSRTSSSVSGGGGGLVNRMSSEAAGAPPGRSEASHTLQCAEAPLP